VGELALVAVGEPRALALDGVGCRGVGLFVVGAVLAVGVFVGAVAGQRRAARCCPLARCAVRRPLVGASRARGPGGCGRRPRSCSGGASGGSRARAARACAGRSRGDRGRRRAPIGELELERFRGGCAVERDAVGCHPRGRPGRRFPSRISCTLCVQPAGRAPARRRARGGRGTCPCRGRAGRT
jgi:hypothetical protein